MAFYEIGPAYGRDYNNQKAVREAWKNGSDFMILEGSNVFRYGSYVNINTSGIDFAQFIVRYSDNRKTMRL